MNIQNIVYLYNAILLNKKEWTNPFTYGQLTFSENAKTIQEGERIVVSTNGTGANVYPHAQVWSCKYTSPHVYKLTQNEP